MVVALFPEMVMTGRSRHGGWAGLGWRDEFRFASTEKDLPVGHLGECPVFGSRMLGRGQNQRGRCSNSILQLSWQ